MAGHSEQSVLRVGRTRHTGFVQKRGCVCEARRAAARPS